MRVAYVDTSCLVALAFGETGATALARRLGRFDELISANLLDAELRGAYRREQRTPDEGLCNAVSWIIPDRPLTEEITQVLDAGYVRGADCWHLATALYAAESPEAIAFLTLDERQQELATVLGFGN